jgi:hypothetical protein
MKDRKTIFRVVASRIRRFRIVFFKYITKKEFKNNNISEVSKSRESSEFNSKKKNKK